MSGRERSYSVPAQYWSSDEPVTVESIHVL